MVDTPPEEVERDADQIERVPLGFRSRGVVRASAIGMSSLPNTSARACCSFSYVRSLPQMTTVTFSGFTRRRGARAGAAVLRFGELFVSLLRISRDGDRSFRGIVTTCFATSCPSISPS